MDVLQNISHIYRGLILRNRAFASFKSDELDIIYSDLKNDIKLGSRIFDPMSGYGGTMQYFGLRGYKTTNVEINPPAFHWQLLNNPTNREYFNNLITCLINSKSKLPKISEDFSITDNLFSESAILHIKNLYSFINANLENDLNISLLLPFVSRFANYVKSSTNLTHFKKGGFCSYIGWENNFWSYLEHIKKLLNSFDYIEKHHKNILCNIISIQPDKSKYKYLVTSPPYPNYRDYSKIFKIENWVLQNIIHSEVNFEQMIGSNNVSGKNFGEIQSLHANNFLRSFLDKAKTLPHKAKRDLGAYYYPYFSIYFFQMQEAYKSIDNLLEKGAIGYIVVNDNIARDIVVPVGAFTCDVFCSLGYKTESHNITQLSHYGNIGSSAKRINSQHTRHIIKIWKM